MSMFEAFLAGRRARMDNITVLSNPHPSMPAASRNLQDAWKYGWNTEDRFQKSLSPDRTCHIIIEGRVEVSFTIEPDEPDHEEQPTQRAPVTLEEAYRILGNI